MLPVPGEISSHTWLKHRWTTDQTVRNVHHGYCSAGLQQVFEVRSPLACLHFTSTTYICDSFWLTDWLLATLKCNQWMLLQFPTPDKLQSRCVAGNFATPFKSLKLFFSFPQLTVFSLPPNPSPMVEFDTTWQLLNYYQVLPRPPEQILIYTLITGRSAIQAPPSPSLLPAHFLPPTFPPTSLACLGVTHYVCCFRTWFIGDKCAAEGH